MSSTQYSIEYEDYAVPYFGIMIGSLGKRFNQLEEAVKFIEEELHGVLRGDESYPGCAIDGKVWICLGNHSNYWIEKLVYNENGKLIYKGP